MHPPSVPDLHVFAARTDLNPDTTTTECLFGLRRNVLCLARLGRDNRVLHWRDPVDVVRDSAILTDLGLTFDGIVDQLGSSAW
jgi:hypothetical protein